MNLIDFNDIFKSYSKKKVLKGVTFSIKEGSIHGFLGPNAAGKSTLMNILLNEVEKDHGNIHFHSNITIGSLPEKLPLYEEMKVDEYLKFIQEIYLRKNDDFLDEIIRKCGLSPWRKKKINQLSKGYKQRTAIAGCISHAPNLIVLDEPFVGLDPNVMIEMKSFIRNLSPRHTIFISSHQLHDLCEICDEITIINKGVVLNTGTIEEISKEFNRSQKIELEVIEEEKMNTLEYLREQNFDDIHISSDGKIIIKNSSKNDLRFELAQILKKKNFTILSQREVKVNLEEIFKAVTSEDNLELS